MDKFIFLCLFIGKNSIRRSNQWASLLVFYIMSFFIIGQLFSTLYASKIIWIFYLFVHNFSLALLLKDTFLADLMTQRLQAINRQPLNLVYYLISTTCVYAVLICIVHLGTLPILCYFFQLNLSAYIVQIFVWQACSALLLTSAYLFGATLTQTNQVSVFFNLITVMPTVLPWFLLSYEFLVNHDTHALLAVIAMLFILLPLMIYSQYLVLRSAIRLQ